MVPVAGENAVFNRTAIQRESHMWTAVIDGIHVTSVVIDSNDMAATGHYVQPRCLSSSRGPTLMSFQRPRPSP
jgi:hypothetical protein